MSPCRAILAKKELTCLANMPCDMSRHVCNAESPGQKFKCLRLCRYFQLNEVRSTDTKLRSTTLNQVYIMKPEGLRTCTTHLECSHTTKSMVPVFFFGRFDDQFGYCEGRSWNELAGWPMCMSFKSLKYTNIAKTWKQYGSAPTYYSGSCALCNIANSEHASIVYVCSMSSCDISVLCLSTWGHILM